MAENEQTKICPHCRYWQKKWSLQNPQTTQSIGALCWFILIIAGVLGSGIYFDHLIGPKRDFALYQNQIAVGNSEMSFRMSGSNLMVSVIGVVTNQSDFGWKDVGLEAQLFDRSGKLIDAIQATDGGYGGIVILPHREAAFKIQTRAARNEADYANCKVTVCTAKDIMAWP